MPKHISLPYKKGGKFTPIEPSAAYLEIIPRNIEVTKLFFKNNKYMLRKNGISIYAQVKKMRSEGLRVDYSNVKKMCNHGINGISLTMLNFFCRYWNNKLLDMISCDLEEYDRRMAEAG